MSRTTQIKYSKSPQVGLSLLILFLLCIAPTYVIQSRVSLTQAAKENTQKILERQPKVPSDGKEAEKSP